MATITCRKCHGVGSIPLSAALQGIYDILERAGSEGMTSAGIAKALEDAGDNAQLMAIQNRLTRMEDYGLLSRVRRDDGPETWRIAVPSVLQ
jgi:repressor of nif and glnA expression